MKNNNKEIRQRVVDQVLELMQQGINPWIQPWQNGNSLGNHNCISGHIYTGINIPVLTYSKNDNEFVSNQWITFNQTKKNDGKIIKGSKATKVIFIKKIYFDKKDEKGNLVYDDEGNKEKIPFSLLRETPIFNIEQTENVQLPKAETKRMKDAIAKEDMMKSDKGVKWIDDLYKKLNVSLNYSNETKAFYSSFDDAIQLPFRSMFKNSSGYVATALHELIHWTGHQSRMDRKLGNGYGSIEYAYEELIAETGSAIMNSKYGIQGVIENHASYIKSWINVLKNDPQKLFDASYQSQQGIEYIEENGNLSQ